MENCFSYHQTPVRPELGIVEDDMIQWRLSEIRPEICALLDHCDLLLANASLKTIKTSAEGVANFLEEQIKFFSRAVIRDKQPGKTPFEHLIDIRSLLLAGDLPTRKEVHEAIIHIHALIDIAPLEMIPPKALAG